jgi:hypothetical protein
VDFSDCEKEPVLYFTAGPNDENDGRLGVIHAEKKIVLDVINKLREVSVI